MTADRRNTLVVAALILSMTLGARVLTWLEPYRPRWEGPVALTAERALPVQEVEISYAGTPGEVEALDFDLRDSICWVNADGAVEWRPAGPRVQLIVLGSEGAVLSDAQKRAVLATIGSLSQASGVELVNVRLAPGLQPGRDGARSPQADDLCRLLVRKGIIE